MKITINERESIIEQRFWINFEHKDKEYGACVAFYSVDGEYREITSDDDWYIAAVYKYHSTTGTRQELKHNGNAAEEIVALLNANGDALLAVCFPEEHEEDLNDKVIPIRSAQ